MSIFKHATGMIGRYNNSLRRDEAPLESGDGIMLSDNIPDFQLALPNFRRRPTPNRHGNVRQPLKYGLELYQVQIPLRSYDYRMIGAVGRERSHLQFIGYYESEITESARPYLGDDTFQMDIVGEIDFDNIGIGVENEQVINTTVDVDYLSIIKMGDINPETGALSSSQKQIIYVNMPAGIYVTWDGITGQPPRYTRGNWVSPTRIIRDIGGGRSLLKSKAGALDFGNASAPREK